MLAELAKVDVHADTDADADVAVEKANTADTIDMPAERPPTNPSSNVHQELLDRLAEATTNLESQNIAAELDLEAVTAKAEAQTIADQVEREARSAKRAQRAKERADKEASKSAAQEDLFATSNEGRVDKDKAAAEVACVDATSAVVAAEAVLAGFDTDADAITRDVAKTAAKKNVTALHTLDVLAASEDVSDGAIGNSSAAGVAINALEQQVKSASDALVAAESSLAALDADADPDAKATADAAVVAAIMLSDERQAALLELKTDTSSVLADAAAKIDGTIITGRTEPLLISAVLAGLEEDADDDLKSAGEAAARAILVSAQKHLSERQQDLTELEAANGANAKPDLAKEAGAEAADSAKPDTANEAVADAADSAKPDTANDAADSAKPDTANDAADSAKPDTANDAGAEAADSTEPDTANEAGTEAADSAQPDTANDAADTANDAKPDTAIDAKPDTANDAGAEAADSTEPDIANEAGAEAADSAQSFLRSSWMARA